MHFVSTLLVAAAPSTPWEQVKAVPKETWINIGICLITVVAIIRLWRGLRKFNEFAPYIVAVLASGLIFFYWVYERSEPRFLTPLIDKLAPFFPSKDKQRDIDEKRRRGRDV